MYITKWKIFLSFLLFFPQVSGDNFENNIQNNHGYLGIINTPTARFYDESSYAMTLYAGNPDSRFTLTSYPFDWLEASLFYTSIDDKPYPGSGFTQDYKDKGFNFKIRLKEEGVLPAIALGINDIGGTGLYSSEYIVASYGINNIDLNFGLGWGNMSGGLNFKNPLISIHNRFNQRNSQIGENYLLEGTGELNFGDLFSGQKSSIFLGASYVYSEKLVFKVEIDPTLTPGPIGFKKSNKNLSFGTDLRINKNFTIGISAERNNYISMRFSYKSIGSDKSNQKKYKSADLKTSDKFIALRRNLEANGIGVNRILESPSEIGVELTQYRFGNLDEIEEIIASASIDAGIDKPVRKELRIVNLNSYSEFDDNFENSSKTIYLRKKKRGFYSDNKLNFRPFLASREEFFKGALLLENNSEFIFSDNFIFSSNLKYSLYNNFDDLNIPPRDTYPAQVRSDIKDYLKNFDSGILIGRAQFDYFFTPKRDNHLMFTAGILEEMFQGYGFEYLYFKQDTNYAFGLELFHVKKRDYELNFGTLDYKNVTSAATYYHRNYGSIPFDLKISFGEYLAGDEGFTFDVSRTFRNGTKFGVFATFTDVSKQQFGEGSFDKGIYFNVPIFGNFINYSWRPLTKDPGQKLIRKNTLHDLLIKFRPLN